MNTPKTLTASEQSLILQELIVNQGTEKQQRKGLRNICMALCMLDAGLRVGELIVLKVCDLWFKDQPVKSLLILTEKTKNDDTRQIPISKKLWESIIDMSRRYWIPDHCLGYSFAFYQKETVKPMTTRQVERIIRSAAIAAIGRPVHPHVLRHTFATKLMRVTDMRTVQLLLGHKNLASTQVYLHPNSDDLKNAIDQLDQKPGHEVS